MNRFISKYMFYLPSTLAKGENVLGKIGQYRAFSSADPAVIRAYQLERLRYIVSYSLKNSPFYSRLYRGVGVHDEKDITSFDDFQRLPIITKADIIGSLDEISTTNSRWVGEKTTGGSTGEPVKIKKNVGALARERAATWRAYEWANVYPGDPQARFWGVPHSKIGKIKAQVTDIVANRKRLSAFDVHDESLLRYYHEIVKFNAAYLYGYVSVIDVFAEFLVRKGLCAPASLKSVITTSEVLTEGARDRIQSAFKVRVFNEYGCGEVGSIAHECEAGGMHIMADNLYVELDGGRQSGELIVTDFFNTATPLIRYRLGDFASVKSERCSCGRGLPMLEGIHGRAYDLIQTPSGRKIHPESIIYVFEGLQSRFGMFSQFQVIQTHLTRFEIKIVPAKGWGEESRKLLLEALKKDVGGDMEFDLLICQHIDREKSGKMRLVKSAL